MAGVVHQNHQRETLLWLPMGELSGWQLLASCGACRADRIVLVRELIARYGSEQRLVMLVPKLRCGQCRRPPSGVILRNRNPPAMGGWV
jgi:hypothetical protein